GEAAPLLTAQLGSDPLRAQAGMGEGERDDPLLQMRPQLVRHPRPTPFPDPECLQAPAVDPLLPAVVGRVVDAHRWTGRTDTDLAREREKAQAEAEEDVIMRHRAHLARVWRLRDEAERTTGRHPSLGGGVRSQKGSPGSRKVSRELGVRSS